MTPTSAALERLASLSARLNAETDRLNESIKQIEKALGRMKLGVSVWLDDVIRPAGGEEADHGYQLGYARLRDKWRIAVRRVPLAAGAVGEPDDPVALVKAPRLVRVQGIRYIDALVDELTGRVSYFLDSILEARQAASADGAGLEDAGASAEQEAAGVDEGAPEEPL